MSDLSEEEIIYTKLDNGSMTIFDLLDYWYIKYGIQKYQIDIVKNYISEVTNDSNTKKNKRKKESAFK